MRNLAAPRVGTRSKRQRHCKTAPAGGQRGREGARERGAAGRGALAGGGLAAPSTRASGSHGRCSRAGLGDVATAAGAACGPRVPAAPSGALPGGAGGGWGPDPAGCRAPLVPAMRSARPGLPAAPTLTRRRSRGTAGLFRSVRARLGPQHPRAGAGPWRELTPSGQGANGSPALQDTAATSDARLLKKHTQPRVRVAGRAPRLPAGRGRLAVRPQPALPGSAPCLAPRRAGTRGRRAGTQGLGGAGARDSPLPFTAESAPVVRGAAGQTAPTQSSPFLFIIGVSWLGTLRRCPVTEPLPRYSRVPGSPADSAGASPGVPRTLL